MPQSQLFIQQRHAALSCAEKALKLDPDFGAACSAKGYALNALGRFLEALEAYESALKLNSNMAFAWNGKGNVLLNLGKKEEALICFEKTLLLNPPKAALDALARAK